jgi:hypothetical protein
VSLAVEAQLDADPDAVQEATGCDLRIAPQLRTTEPPTDAELSALCALVDR